MATPPEGTLGTPIMQVRENVLMQTWAAIPLESAHFTCLICLSEGRPSKKSKLSARRHFKNIHPETEIDEMLYLEEKKIRAASMKLSRGIITQSKEGFLHKYILV